MYCFACNALVRLYEDGWSCRWCGASGADSTPVCCLETAIARKQPLVAPHTNPKLSNKPRGGTSE